MEKIEEIKPIIFLELYIPLKKGSGMLGVIVLLSASHSECSSLQASIVTEPSSSPVKFQINDEEQGNLITDNQKSLIYGEVTSAIPGK